MTEEQRKEDVLKRYKDLPKGVVKYIDFLIAKINKLVSENKTLKESKQIQTIVVYSQAKEIITSLLKAEEKHMYFECDGSDKKEYYELRKQAEQFLKEIEK